MIKLQNKLKRLKKSWQEKNLKWKDKIKKKERRLIYEEKSIIREMINALKDLPNQKEILLFKDVFCDTVRLLNRTV